jgi:hypothetical protein
MKPRNCWMLMLLTGCASMALAMSADLPRILHARLEQRSAASGLEARFHDLLQTTAGSAWIAYSVPMVPGHKSICCSNSSEGWTEGLANCGPCRLEDGATVTGVSHTSPPVKLERDARLLVLFRIAAHRETRIRIFTENCELDAAGLPVYWLTDVQPAQSVALLESFVRGASREKTEENRHLGRAALAALALSDGAPADQALQGFVAAAQPEWLRKDTAFWLGEARGRRGLELLQRLVRQDPSERVREHAVFALSLSKAPGALPALIDVAHHDADAEVRAKALFWLAQKAGRQAEKAITEAIQNDPETLFSRSRNCRGTRVCLC